MIIFGYDLVLNDEFVPNCINEKNEETWKKFKNRSGWFNHPSCYSPMLYTLNEYNIEFEQKSIDELKDESGWLYPVELLQYPKSWFAQLHPEDKKEEKWWFSKISEQAYSCIREGKAKLLLFNGIQGFDPFYHKLFEGLYDVLDTYKIPAQNVIFVTSTAPIQDHYNEWMEGKNLERMVMYEYPHLEEMSKIYFNRFIEDGKGLTWDQVSAGHKRSKNYLCYNRIPYFHRQATVLDLRKRGLLDKGKVSMASPEAYKHFLHEFSDTLPENGHIKTLHRKEYDDTFINELPYIADKIDLINCHGTTVIPETHNDVYFQLITERTFASRPFIFLTEKIWKSMFYYNPFVLMGPYKTLKYLKENGYKTFSPLIDESYDLLLDCDERFQAVLDEVERLCNMSENDIHKWYQELLPILKYNYEHFFSDRGNVRRLHEFLNKC